MSQTQQETKTKLSPDFVIELLKSCFQNEKILQICRKELKFEYLENDIQKKIVKYLFEKYDLENRLPTWGEIGQRFNDDGECITLLAKIKNARPPDNKEVLLPPLEEYIKRSEFQIIIDSTVRLYNEGKFEEAVAKMAQESERINNFKLKENYYTRIFADYEKREERRTNKDIDIRSLQKLTFGIQELDDITRGGFNKKTSVGILARSGAGKSTFMKWIGVQNAYLGSRVVHFQAEGSKDECEDLYDSCWTGQKTEDVEIGNISPLTKAKIKKARHTILENGGEIFVYASETFDTMSLEDCYEIMKDITEIYGEIDLAIFDYGELFNVKGKFSGESGERRRREMIGNRITNIGLLFGCGTVTAYQANDIKMEIWNNPEKHLTRSDLAEFKGSIKPLSYFLTLNQTLDESEEGIMRIYCDKFRKYKSGQTVRIYQDITRGRFCDMKRTINEFYSK